jgi:hypothetical protein
VILVALMVLCSGGVLWLLALSLHSPSARGAEGNWRGVESARVPVNAAPMGAFRDEGLVAIPFDGVPRSVRRASFIASAAAVGALPQPWIGAILIAVCAESASENYWMPAFLVVLLVSYACVLQLDAARLALLRRAPSAVLRARIACWLVAMPHTLLAAASPALPFYLGRQPALVWIAVGVCGLMSLGLAAASLVLLRAALDYRRALAVVQ